MQPKSKVLGLRDITLYTVSAMLFMDQIALAASLGASSLFWWGYVLLFLFIPMAMISSELGTSYPRNGGVYQWVRQAFGYRWGARISWMYWITNAIWMPSVYILFAGMLAELFLPGLALWYQVAIGIALALTTAACNVVALRLGKWLPNIGAVLKVFAVLALGIAGIRYGIVEGFANDLSWSSVLPASGADIAALGIMVYGVMGTELACSCADEMARPKRDLPRAILLSGLIIGAFNVFGTLGILAAVPADQSDVTQVFIHALYNLYGQSPAGHAFATFVACCVIFTLFTNMVTWSLGTNRAAVEAAEAGELPPLFGRTHPRHGSPVGAAWLAATISSLVLLIYGMLATSAQELFWSLLAFSAMIFLMPYVAMLLAFIRLRRDDPRERPYRLPLSNRFATVVAGFVATNIAAAILMFVYVPGEPLDWVYAGQVVGGILVALGSGEWMIRRCDKRAASDRSAALQPAG